MDGVFIRIQKTLVCGEVNLQRGERGYVIQKYVLSVLMFPNLSLVLNKLAFRPFRTNHSKLLYCLSVGVLLTKTVVSLSLSLSNIRLPEVKQA